MEVPDIAERPKISADEITGRQIGGRRDRKWRPTQGAAQLVDLAAPLFKILTSSPTKREDAF
jgi:hypothetical protein